MPLLVAFVPVLHVVGVAGKHPMSYTRPRSSAAIMRTRVGTLQSSPPTNMMDIWPASPSDAAEPLPPAAVARAAPDVIAAATARTAPSPPSPVRPRGKLVLTAMASGLRNAGNRAAMMTEKAPMLLGGGVTAMARWRRRARTTPRGAAHLPPRPAAAVTSARLRMASPATTRTGANDTAAAK